MIRHHRRNKHLALFLMAIQRAVAYRRAVLLNLAANLVWVVISYSFWRAVFADRAEVADFTWPQMQTYLLLSFAINSLHAFQTEVRMFGAIRTGQVVVDLTRPIDYLSAKLAEACGAAAVDVLLVAPIAVAVGLLFFQVTYPASGVAPMVVAVSVLFGFMTKFLLSYLTGLLCFWTQNAVGLIWFRTALTSVLSGAVVPLSLLPDGLRTVALHSPFQSIVDAPISIYMGRQQGADIVVTIVVQVAWMVALYLLARVAWRSAARALVIQGG